MKTLTFAIFGLLSLSALAHPPQNISVTVDGQVYQCQGQSHPGHQNIIGIELFDTADCGGTPRWTVRTAAQCSGTRPDFYCPSAKLLFGSGATFCLRFERMEEDAACRYAFQN